MWNFKKSPSSDDKKPPPRYPSTPSSATRRANGSAFRDIMMSPNTGRFQTTPRSPTPSAVGSSNAMTPQGLLQTSPPHQPTANGPFSFSPEPFLPSTGSGFAFGSQPPSYAQDFSNGSVPPSQQAFPFGRPPSIDPNYGYDFNSMPASQPPSGPPSNSSYRSPSGFRHDGQNLEHDNQVGHAFANPPYSQDSRPSETPNARRVRECRERRQRQAEQRERRRLEEERQSRLVRDAVGAVNDNKKFLADKFERIADSTADRFERLAGSYADRVDEAATDALNVQLGVLSRWGPMGQQQPALPGSAQSTTAIVSLEATVAAPQGHVQLVPFTTPVASSESTEQPAQPGAGDDDDVQAIDEQMARLLQDYQALADKKEKLRSRKPPPKKDSGSESDDSTESA